MKTQTLQIRISEKDKASLKELAEKNQMTMSEYVTYIIRRESEK